MCSKPRRRKINRGREFFTTSYTRTVGWLKAARYWISKVYPDFSVSCLYVDEDVTSSHNAWFEYFARLSRFELKDEASQTQVPRFSRRLPGLCKPSTDTIPLICAKFTPETRDHPISRLPEPCRPLSASSAKLKVNIVIGQEYAILVCRASITATKLRFLLDRVRRRFKCIFIPP